MALVHVIDIASGEVTAAYPVPPTTNIPVQEGQEVQFVDIPYGNPNSPDVIIEVIEDRDVRVTTEDGAVQLEGLFALLENGQQTALLFSDTGQVYGTGADAVAVPEFASLDAFTAAAAGPGAGPTGQTGTGGRGNDGSINPLDLNVNHVRAAGIEGDIPRPEFNLEPDIETDFLGDEEVAEIILTPSTAMVWEKGLDGGRGAREFIFVTDGDEIGDEEGDDNNEILKIALDGSSATVAVSHEEIAAAIGTSDFTMGESGVQVDAAGNIFFTTDEGEENDDEFVVVKLANGSLQVIADISDVGPLTEQESFDPEDLVLGPDGTLYVLDETNGGQIFKITDPLGTPNITLLTSAGQIVSDANGIDAIDVDFGIAISPDGSTVYFPSGMGGDPQGVIAVDTTTGDASIFNTNDPGFSDLDEFITTAPNGDLIVADEGNDTIYRVDADTGVVTVFLTEAQIESVIGDDARLDGGFGFDSAGNFYLAEENTDNILVWPVDNLAEGTIDPDAGSVLITGASVQGFAGLGAFPDYEGGLTIGGMPGSGNIEAEGASVTVTRTVETSLAEGSVQYVHFTIDADTDITISTDGPTIDPFIRLFVDDGDLTADDFLALDDDSGPPAGSFNNSVININLPAGSYVVAVADHNLSLAEALSGINDSDDGFGGVFTGDVDITIAADSAIVTVTTDGFTDDPGTMPDTDLEFAFGTLDTGGGTITSISHPDGATSVVGDFFVVEGTFPGGEGIDWILRVNKNTGDYEFELLDNTLDHPGINLIGEDDQVFLTFNYSVDVGGQSASSTLTVSVKDDGPLISLKDGEGTPMVSEEELPLFDKPQFYVNDKLQDYPDYADYDFPMAEQGINFDFGADGPALEGMGFTISFEGATDGDDTDGEGGAALPLELLTSADDLPVNTYYDAETKTLFGFTNEGEEWDGHPDSLVFTVELVDPMGGPPGPGMITAKFTLYQAIEHPDINETQGDDPIDLLFKVTATDGDGDSASVDVVFEVKDDGPTVHVDGEGGRPDMLILDESPVPPDGDGIATTTASFADNFGGAFDFGADGPGTASFSLKLVGENVGSSLYALDPNQPNGQGEEIVLNQDGNTITGTVGEVVYFTIEINPETGEVTFTQMENIWHSDPTDDDEAETLTTEYPDLLQVVLTVTDADGDSDSGAINLGRNVFKIEDDGPDAAPDGEGRLDMLVLDETRPLGTETDGNSDPAGLDTVTAQFADNFAAPVDHGTDGPGDVSYSLSLNGNDVGSGLYALEQGDTDDGGDGDGFGQGEEIVLNQTGDTITGSVDGVPYFTISINPDTGAVTFTQLENKNIWHSDRHNDDDSEALTTEYPSDLQIVQTVTDADGDSVSATIDLGGGNVFKIEDDGPTGKDDTYTATEISGPVNLLLILDVSGSMDDDSGVEDPDNPGTNFNRLELAVAALKSLLNSLPPDTTTVQLISFSTGAQEPVPGVLTVAEAHAALDVLLANGAFGQTNYDAPIDLAQAEYNPDPTETNLIYFLSDGNPNIGKLNDTETQAWEDHVDSVNATAFAIGVGDGIDEDNDDLADVAHPGDPVIVDEADLEDTLVDTISQSFVEGNVLTGDDNGGVADMFGTDGPGGIMSITVDGRTFFSDGSDSGAGGTGNFSFAGSELTVETELGGTLVFDFETGAFSYTGPNTEGEEQEVFPYVIVDRDGDPSEALLTINLPDSVPVANDDTYSTAAQAPKPVNLLLILDVSGSMDDDSGVEDPDNPGTNFDRLELAVAALNDMLDELVDATTTVQLISFSSGAQQPAPGVMTIAEARAALEDVLANGANGATNYDAPIDLAQTIYNPDPTETNLIHFLSDGEPNIGTLNNAERQAWENHVNSINATAFAIGVGDGLDEDDSDLEDVAHPVDPIIVDEADLSATLIGTLNTIASVSGNVLTGDANGGVADDFGFDLPGSLVSITVDGVDFTLASPEVVGGVLNVTTLIGGELTFNFNTGDFFYNSPDDLVSDQVETFQYVIADSDGDTATADLIINVADIDEVIGTSGDDDLMGTAADEVLIGGRGDDTLAGGDGNDFLFGGDGSDDLFGDGGTDVFSWSRGDVDVEPDGTVDHVDTVKDYSGVGGDEDVLDISDLLSDLGVTFAADIPSVFQSVQNGADVELQVDVGSGFETFAIIENTLLAELNIDDGGLI